MTSNQTDVSPPEPMQCAGAHMHARQQRIEAFLMSRYGPVLDSPALAEVLRFKTVSALEKSLERGHLPIRCMDTPHRRGTYVLAVDVATYLVSASTGSNEPRPDQLASSAGAQAGKEHEKNPQH
jgi:hypothetical protein